MDTASSGVEQLRSESGKLSQVFEAGANLAEIVVSNRSMMEVLFFASAFIQVPGAEPKRKTVREQSLVNPDWLTVLTSQAEPADAWLKVKFHGHWFYIAGNDLSPATTYRRQRPEVQRILRTARRTL